MKKIYFFILLFVFLTGCSVHSLGEQKSRSVCYIEPAWAINVPHDSKHFYGVGIAYQNFYGEAAQRKLAISRAIKEIASQMKTEVNSKTISVMNSTGSNYFSDYTFQTINGQKVRAKIIKSCKNPKTGILYILMESIK